MATSLSELRKNRGSQLDKVIKDLDSGGRKSEDERFWKPTRDKAGNGSAIIHFLPPMNGDELPWVKTFSYGFKGETGNWFIEESPSTIGKPDPVMELNAAAYASKDESRIAEAKTRKRRTQYISNIYIVKDPANPENDGTVKLFKYGAKIHEMIMGKAKPEFDDDTPILAWDLWEGCNLKLRIKQVAGYPNYDSSEWMSVAPLAEDDDLEAIIKKAHKLSEFTDPSRFKTYDQLKARLDIVMNGNKVQSAADRAASEASGEDEKFDIEKEVKKATAKVNEPRKIEKAAPVADDDSDLDEFKRMLEDLG